MASKIKGMQLVPPSTEKNDDKENQPSTQETQRRPILQISSYDRFTPPSPNPDLQYDCRVTNNPSREMRQTCTGLDDRLQDELMHRTTFNDLCSRAEDDIRRLMEVKDARASREGESAVLRVGCLCGSGHHRSVAFAEQLGKIDWPEEWEVKIEHRDLTEGVEELKKARNEKQCKK